MALTWKTVVAAVGIFSLCFLGIPITVDPPKDVAVQQSFMLFLQAQNKSYEENSVDFVSKLSHFQKSLARARQFNSSRRDPSSAKYGVTKFSDLSQEEFEQKYLSPNLTDRFMKKSHRDLSIRKHHLHEISKSKSKNRHKRATIDAATGLPLVVDWRKKGIITPVKNQKTCGACWAFSTIETIESMLALKGNSVVLSVQQGVDCATNGNIGCGGGDTCRFLEWMNLSKIALMPENKYPFTGVTGSCKVKDGANSVGTRITSNYTCANYVGSEDDLLKVLATHGPVAVAVNALNWQNYVGGVIQFHCDGSPLSLNHAVQIVGYDKTAPIPHYIVRNSWGTDFGDKGYLYIAIGGNVCGLANEVSAVDIL